MSGPCCRRQRLVYRAGRKIAPPELVSVRYKAQYGGGLFSWRPHNPTSRGDRCARRYLLPHRSQRERMRASSSISHLLIRTTAHQEVRRRLSLDAAVPGRLCTRGYFASAMIFAQTAHFGQCHLVLLPSFWSAQRHGACSSRRRVLYVDRCETAGSDWLHPAQSSIPDLR